MRRAVLITLIFLLALSLPAFAKDLPGMGKSAVTIPWDDFKVLLEKLQQGDPTVEPAPPIDYALGRGTLAGELDGGVLEIRASYPLTIFKKGWVRIPLVNISTPMSEILIDGKTAPVADYNGQVSLVLKGPGAHKLTMRFRATAPMRPGPGTVSLGLPQAAGQVLLLKSGTKLSGVTVDGATVSTTPDGATSAILTGDSLTVRYTVASEKKEQTQEKLPPKVLVENSTLVSIDEGFIRAVVHLSYEVRHAPVEQFKLLVPEGFEVADCSGASLVGWKVDDKTRELTATVGFEVKGAYALTLVLERSTQNETFSFGLPGVQAKGVERERGYFAVQVTGGVEVTSGKEIEGLQQVDSKELPAVLRGGATNPVVLSFKYLRHPFKADLHVVRHTPQPVLGAAIDSANYVVAITQDGDFVTRAEYTVRNNRKQFIKVTLPGGDKVALWSSFVAGKPVRPSKTKEGQILLPLEKSSYTGSELERFKVELIYYSNLGKDLSVLGGISLVLPEVDLPISRSALTVFAPERYEYKRVGGSMREQYIAPKPIPFSLGAAKMMSPSPLIGYEQDVDDEISSSLEAIKLNKPKMKSQRVKQDEQRRRQSSISAATAKLSSRGGIDSIMAKQEEAEQVFQTRIRAAQSSKDQSGALPARFAVPTVGATMRFSELITIGEASSLKLMYSSRKIGSVLSFFALIIAGLFAWYSRRILQVQPAQKGRKLFGAIAIAIVALVMLGASVGHVILGAVLGLGALFVRWVGRHAIKQHVAGPKRPGQ